MRRWIQIRTMLVFAGLVTVAGVALAAQSALAAIATTEADAREWVKHTVFAFAVPLVERNGRDRLRSFPVTVWSDEQKRHELSLVVFENFVALAIAYQDGRNDKLEIFLDVLQTARRTFAIAYDNRVFQFDVSKLPEARARFMQLCRGRQMQASLKTAN